MLRALSGDPFLVVDGELYLHKQLDSAKQKGVKGGNAPSVEPMSGFLGVASLVHRLRGKLQNPSMSDILQHVPSLPLYCLFDVASYSPRVIPAPERAGAGCSQTSKASLAVLGELRRIQQRCMSEHHMQNIEVLQIVPNVTPFSLRLRTLGFLSSLLQHASRSTILKDAFCPWIAQNATTKRKGSGLKGSFRTSRVVGGQYVNVIPYSLCESLGDAKSCFLRGFVKNGFEGAVIRTPLNVYAMREKRRGTIFKLISAGAARQLPLKKGVRRLGKSNDPAVVECQQLLQSSIKKLKKLPRRSPTAVKLLLYRDDEFPVLKPLFKEPSSNPRTRQLAEVSASSLKSTDRIKKSSSSPHPKKGHLVSFFGLQCLAGNGRIFTVTLPKLSLEKQKELLKHLQGAQKGKKSLTGLYVTVKYSTLTEHGIPRFGTVKAIRGGKGWFL